LDANYVSDISALSNIKDVEELYLQNNFISDISSLTDLTKLRWLELEGNYLDPAAYAEHLPQIIASNPLAEIAYDPEI